MEMNNGYVFGGDNIQFYHATIRFDKLFNLVLA